MQEATTSFFLSTLVVDGSFSQIGNEGTICRGGLAKLREPIGIHSRISPHLYLQKQGGGRCYWNLGSVTREEGQLGGAGTTGENSHCHHLGVQKRVSTAGLTTVLWKAYIQG